MSSWNILVSNLLNLCALPYCNNDSISDQSQSRSRNESRGHMLDGSECMRWMMDISHEAKDARSLLNCCWWLRLAYQIFLTMPPCGVSLTKTHSLGEERERANIEHHNIYYVNAVPYYFHLHNIAIKPWSYCQGLLIKYTPIGLSKLPINHLLMNLPIDLPLDCVCMFSHQKMKIK